MQATAMLLATTCIVSACSAEDLAAPGPARAEDAERVVVSSDRGQVTVKLVRNEATQALLRMLPLTIAMRDHLRQEKTGSLPSPLPEQPRQLEFSAGTIGLWGDRDFVIYYRDGSVPRPGIIVLGRVNGSARIFDIPGPLTVRIQRGE